jgi:hypothetical protein
LRNISRSKLIHLHSKNPRKDQKILGKILMSKFLLNLLLQISKVLVYSKKSNFYSEKNFPSLSAQSAQRPTGPAAAHLFFFNQPLPLSPLGLRLSAGPARCLGPADLASVAPCPIAASHSRKRISRKPPSLHECALPENLPPPLGPYQPARHNPDSALACRLAQAT